MVVVILLSANFNGGNYGHTNFIGKFDRENIDGQHPRPPVLAVLLENNERESLTHSQLH